MHPSLSFSLPNRRGVLKDDSKAAQADKDLVGLLFRQKPLNAYRAYWACCDQKRHGSGVLVKKDIAVKSIRRSVTSNASPTTPEGQGHVEVGLSLPAGGSQIGHMGSILVLGVINLMCF